ncbi:50S ribosomal protein L25 [Desulfovibrio oxyclinae]|uniref:50S ribosomal protein L25 n=1 Tax=Desulfovibrio oxyclinae TaxID=63560 RepID=UPI00035E72A0|nr:50S ribosomal protein L25 [Desulfovibrio oxyclinae]
MSDRITVKVFERKETGKGPNRRLRSSGFVPGVFYNQKGVNIPVKVPYAPLQKAYAKLRNTQLLDLELERDGKVEKITSLIWRMKYDPVKPLPIHVDFFGVDMEKPLKVTVPFKLEGTAKGVKAGGRLEQYREQCEIIALPSDIPVSIPIDITKLGINARVHIEDVPMPEGVSPQFDDNFAILTILAKGAASGVEDELEELDAEQEESEEEAGEEASE